VQCTGLCHPNFAGPGKPATAQHESEARLSGSSKYTGPDQQYYNWGFLNQLTCTVKDAVVHRGLVPPLLPGWTLYVHACHPRGALPAPGLAGCPVGRGE